MPPTPLYYPDTKHAAYQLRYSWTGWPSAAVFPEQPIHLIEQTKLLWEEDHLRVLEYRWTDERVQILFSATPDVAPVFVTARAKGRLDHALRTAGYKYGFSRKVAIRAVGDNTRRDVEVYTERQVAKQRFVDPRFANQLSAFTVVDPHVDLSQPSSSARGVYWYNLHLVLIVDGHQPIRDISTLRDIRDQFFRVARRKGHAVSRLSVLPTHLHAAMRGLPEESPIDLVFAYQNNLACGLRLGRIWAPGFYAGTFGEYSMQALRRAAFSTPSCALSAQGGWGRE